jgi:hypothetical protein
MPTKNRLLELALIGLEAERTKIDQEISQIKSQLRGTDGRSVAVGNEAAAKPKKRRKMSAAARKKISEAMKRRYAQKKMAAKS